MMDFNEQGQDHQTASQLEQSSLEEETSATRVKDFPEPLIPRSQAVGIVLFRAMWVVQPIKLY